MAGRKPAKTEDSVSQFIAAYISTGSITAAADIIRVSARTIRRWKSDPITSTLFDQVKEFAKQLRLGANRDTASKGAGITADDYFTLCRSRDVLDAISKVESQAKLDAYSLIRELAKPHKTKTVSVVRTTCKDNERIVHTVKEKDAPTLTAANLLLKKNEEKQVILSAEVNAILSGKSSGQNTGITGDDSEQNGRNDSQKQAEAPKKQGDRRAAPLTRQPHGGAIVNAPGFGRPPDRKASLKTALEALNDIRAETGNTYAADFAHSAVLHAIGGNIRFAELVKEMLEAGVKIELDAEFRKEKRQSGQVSELTGQTDPLFAGMSDADLMREVALSLQGFISEQSESVAPGGDQE